MARKVKLQLIEDAPRFGWLEGFIE